MSSTQVIGVRKARPLLPPLKIGLERLRRAVWRALEEQGRRRGRRELMALADRWQFQDPALAAELRAAAGRDRQA